MAITYDDEKDLMILYLDGEPKNLSKSGTLSSNDIDFCIGASLDSGPTEFFDGTIGEVIVYRRAISRQDLQLMYNAGSP